MLEQSTHATSILVIAVARHRHVVLLRTFLGLSRWLGGNMCVDQQALCEATFMTSPERLTQEPILSDHHTVGVFRPTFFPRGKMDAIFSRRNGELFFNHPHTWILIRIFALIRLLFYFDVWSLFLLLDVARTLFLSKGKSIDTQTDLWEGTKCFDEEKICGRKFCDANCQTAFLTEEKKPLVDFVETHCRCTFLQVFEVSLQTETHHFEHFADGVSQECQTDEKNTFFCETTSEETQTDFAVVENCLTADVPEEIDLLGATIVELEPNMVVVVRTATGGSETLEVGDSEDAGISLQTSSGGDPYSPSGSAPNSAPSSVTSSQEVFPLEDAYLTDPKEPGVSVSCQTEKIEEKIEEEKKNISENIFDVFDVCDVTAVDSSPTSSVDSVTQTEFFKEMTSCEVQTSLLEDVEEAVKKIAGWPNLAGTGWPNLAGTGWPNLAGTGWPNLVGTGWPNLAGTWPNLAGTVDFDVNEELCVQLDEVTERVKGTEERMKEMQSLLVSVEEHRDALLKTIQTERQLTESLQRQLDAVKQSSPSTEVEEENAALISNLKTELVKRTRQMEEAQADLLQTRQTLSQTRQALEERPDIRIDVFKTFCEEFDRLAQRQTEKDNQGAPLALLRHSQADTQAPALVGQSQTDDSSSQTTLLEDLQRDLSDTQTSALLRHTQADVLVRHTQADVCLSQTKLTEDLRRDLADTQRPALVRQSQTDKSFSQNQTSALLRHSQADVCLSQTTLIEELRRDLANTKEEMDAYVKQLDEDISLIYLLEEEKELLKRQLSVKNDEIEDLQTEIDEKNKKLEEKNKKNDEKKNEIEEKNQKIEEKNEEILQKTQKIEEQISEILQKTKEIEEKNLEIFEKEKKILEKSEKISELRENLIHLNKKFEKMRQDVAEANQTAAQTLSQLQTNRLNRSLRENSILETSLLIDLVDSPSSHRAEMVSVFTETDSLIRVETVSVGTLTDSPQTDSVSALRRPQTGFTPKSQTDSVTRPQTDSLIALPRPVFAVPVSLQKERPPTVVPSTPKGSSVPLPVGREMSGSALRQSAQSVRVGPPGGGNGYGYGGGGYGGMMPTVRHLSPPPEKRKLMDIGNSALKQSGGSGRKRVQYSSVPDVSVCALDVSDRRSTLGAGRVVFPEVQSAFAATRPPPNSRIPRIAGRPSFVHNPIPPRSPFRPSTDKFDFRMTSGMKTALNSSSSRKYPSGPYNNKGGGDNCNQQ